MWPCWFILLFISGVPSAWRFYFFIRSVRAFGTTQSLLFISFTKPSMTTLPSSSSKVNLNDIVVPSARNASFNSQYNFKVITLFYLFRVGQRYSITKTGKWLKLLTLPPLISKCIQVSTMFASLTAGLRKKKGGFLVTNLS